MEKHEYTFPNGFNAVLVPNKSIPVVTMQGWVRGGNAMDTRKCLGSIVPSMLNKGTEMRSREEFEDALDRYALEYSAIAYSASCFFVAWGGRAMRDYISELIGLAAESLRYPSFPDDELGMIRARWIARVRGNEDDPVARAEDEVLRMLYGPRHPYFALSSNESIAQIKSITRDDLLSFWGNHYSPEGVGVVVVGDINPHDVCDKLQEAFGGWRAPEKSDEDGYDETRNEYKEDGYEERVVFIPEKASAVLWMGQRISISSVDPVYPALKAAVMILGEGMNSRLFRHIRGKHGLSYHAGASLDRMHTMPGYFSAFAHTNPDNIKKTQQETLWVLNDFWERGITEEELENTKQILRGNRAHQLSSLRGVAIDIVLGKIAGISSGEIEERVNRLSVKEVNLVIRNFLDPSRMKIVRAGTVR